MADHSHSTPFDPSRDRTLRSKGAVYTRRALIAGIVCIALAAVVAAFSGTQRISQVYEPKSAPSALVGVVQLLAEKEGKPVEAYANLPLAEIAEKAQTQFGNELPHHWDDFLHQSATSGWQRFQAGYLIAFLFVTSISLGALFFVLIQHLVRAGWSVMLRRITEFLAASSAWIALLSLPIVVPLFFGGYLLFAWNDPHLIETDALIRHKRPWLNPTFFAIRTLIYFSVWSIYGRYLLSLSRTQDETGDPALTNRMQAVAPVGMLLFALTANFFAFDFMMSVAPNWYSAIYGIYYFSGAVVASLAVMILLAQWLQKQHVIGPELTTEHYHDLGKLLFGFNFFWGYIAFSQYILIWYANIPEETVWLIRRQENGWAVVSLALLFGHLFLPFFGIMSRKSRRSPGSLLFWSCWLLVMHWLDLYWNVMPEFSLSPWPGLIDGLLLAGVVCLAGAAFLRTASHHSFVPVRDPRLKESLAFHNV